MEGRGVRGRKRREGEEEVVRCPDWIGSWEHICRRLSSAFLGLSGVSSTVTG